MIRDYMAARRKEDGLPPLNLGADELPCDENSLKEDETTKERMMKIIETQQPDLLKYEIEGEGKGECPSTHIRAIATLQQGCYFRFFKAITFFGHFCLFSGKRAKKTLFEENW